MLRTLLAILLLWLLFVVQAGAHPAHQHHAAGQGNGANAALHDHRALASAPDVAATTSHPCPGDGSGACCCNLTKGSGRSQAACAPFYASYVLIALLLLRPLAITAPDLPSATAEPTLSWAHGCRAPPALQ